MVLLYTDASTSKRGGAWAYLLVNADPTSYDRDYRGETSGLIFDYGFGPTGKGLSSSEAELIAAINGIDNAIGRGMRSIVVVCDNTSVVNGIRNSYQLSRYGATAMRKHWQRILEQSLKIAIKSVHIKGHQQQTFNVLCDRFASMVRRSYEIENKRARLEVAATIRHQIGLCNSAHKKANAWRKSIIRNSR